MSVFRLTFRELALLHNSQSGDESVCRHLVIEPKTLGEVIVKCSVCLEALGSGAQDPWQGYWQVSSVYGGTLFWKTRPLISLASVMCGGSWLWRTKLLVLWASLHTEAYSTKLKEDTVFPSFC